jgi:hypothetical protein
LRMPLQRLILRLGHLRVPLATAPELAKGCCDFD